MSTPTVHYTLFEDSDYEALLIMGLKLWNDFDKDQLEAILRESTRSEKNRIIIARNTDQVQIAFAIFSIRQDYVEGASQSPTGYLEGIYVESDYRRSEIAKTLVQQGETWCKSKGCIQIGSDTWLTDHRSRAFHQSIGFWEEGEVVHFLKNIE